MDKRYFSDKVVEWYENNKRDLPWRETTDPYKIWLSEVILQQTRVSQGLPYYLRFIEKFPDVKSLASASEQEVLRQWQGLGYYTRARNLHKCAQQVVLEHQSKFPGSFESLKKLSGIGDYTAAAIASIAFKENVAVVDGNVFRVLSRIFGLSDEINSPQGRKFFKTLANDLIDNRHPDLHNQAMMEFGALHCTPKNPACTICIFAASCFAAQKNMQHELPVKASSKAPRRRYFYYLVVKKGRTLLMNRRGSGDIWNGMYDFCLMEKDKPLPIKAIVQNISLSTCSNIKPENVEISTEYKHVLTHQVIFSRFIVVEWRGDFGLSNGNLKFYSTKKIGSLPKPVLISRFLADYNFL